MAVILTPTLKFLKQGSLFPNPTILITDEDGSPVDCTGATVVFAMQSKNDRTGTLKVAWSAGTMLNQASQRGKFIYQQVLGDVDTPGEYWSNWKFTDLPGMSNPTIFPADAIGYTIVVVKTLPV